MNTQELSKAEGSVMGIKLTVMTLDIDPSSKPITKVFYKDELTLGRLPSNDVVLSRPEISGIHARLRIEKGGKNEAERLFITDLGSSNGTSVEKNQLRPRMEIAMMPNERIFIGNYVIKPTIISETQENLNGSAKGDEPKKQEITQKQEPMSVKGSTQVLNKELLSEAVKEFESGAFGKSFTQEAKTYSDKPSEEDKLASKLFPDDSGQTGYEPNKPTISFEKPKYEDIPEDIVAKLSNGDEAVQNDAAEGGEELEETSKTMEFRSPFGSPITSEEEEMREAREVEDKIEKTENKISEEQTETKNQEHDFSASSTPQLTTAQPVSEVNDIPEAGVQQSSENAIKIKVEGGDLHSLNFTASAYTSVTGKVMHKNNPLAGVKVDAGSIGSTMTKEDGSFEFLKILEGTSYTLKLSKEKFTFSPDTFNGEALVKNQPLQASATQLFTISGIVSHHGEPLEGVEVNGGELGTVYTKEDGSYSFENVPEGKEYSITLHKEGYEFRK